MGNCQIKSELVQLNEAFVISLLAYHLSINELDIY